MNITPLQLLFGTLVICITLFKLYLNQRQVTSITKYKDQIPAKFAQYLSLAQHQKAAAYNIAKLKLNELETIFSAIILFIFTLGGGLQLINNQFTNFSDMPLSQGVVVITVFSCVNFILSLPFAIYSTFSIEHKFGFNKTTGKLFVLDLIKNTLLSAIIGIPILYLVLCLMQIMGNYWWLWVFATLSGLNLLMLILYPTIIAPLFNKFTPLTDEALRDRIQQLLHKCGFKTNGIFVMDGSKRSNHGNAYFTGIGKSKRIVFFDTLINQLTPDEIEAVLAHELGHFKGKHMLKQMLFLFSLSFIALFVLSTLIKSPLFYNTLGVNSITNQNALILFMLLLDVVLFPLSPLASYLSRKNEFEADNFAKKYSNKNDLINGLVKLFRESASTLTPDPLYVKYYYSHPPATIRIAALQADD